MQKNRNLHSAKTAKNDEFYTQLTDIEKELKHYKDQFRGKVIYCNCDDYRVSNFYKYFTLNFNELGLKKLICTGYKADGQGIGAVYDGENESVTFLSSNGDFRSEECVELLKEADIVVSNPPFSLFREYVALLVEYGKQFLIIGNVNAITYKEIFPLIKENKLWLGYCSPNEYILPNGEITKQVNGLCRWFTNLPTEKRNRPLDLYKTYNPEEYPKYDNYLAFNVDRVRDIPIDDYIEIEIDENDLGKWLSVYGDDIEVVI